MKTNVQVNFSHPLLVKLEQAKDKDPELAVQ